MGEVLLCALPGMIDLRMFACVFGSLLLFSSLSSICFLLAFLMVALSLWRNVACFAGFWAGVVDSALVELVLFFYVPFDFWAAPLFFSWFWFFVRGFR